MPRTSPKCWLRDVLALVMRVLLAARHAHLPIPYDEGRQEEARDGPAPAHTLKSTKQCAVRLSSVLPKTALSGDREPS